MVCSPHQYILQGIASTPSAMALYQPDVNYQRTNTDTTRYTGSTLFIPLSYGRKSSSTTYQPLANYGRWTTPMLMASPMSITERPSLSIPASEEENIESPGKIWNDYGLPVYQAASQTKTVRPTRDALLHLIENELQTLQRQKITMVN